ncbi:hypothetical protein IR083_19810 [Dysgonomonas sp. GY75]|uniref:BACON domain-containing protein n=1 Tax=Dysgonomonas sp. GY75 TaxID=2780419 RepID=UPI001883AD58|nr:BACON domain-containing carbohydrate-binding protein [Dysgonomonas sp. GY75]MBF0651066.1 hypothetical protein [Dysgonomonas sp. GY75]
MATKQKILVTGIEDGVGWQAISNQAWLKVTDIVATATEDSFNVSVDPNSVSEVRTGIVTVIPSDNGANGIVNVSQQGAVVYTLSISPTIKSSPSAGGTFAIIVTSNTSWTVSLPGWCTADVTSGTGNGTINVTVAGNTGSQRTGNITVAAGTLTATCAVTQAAYVAPNLSISPTTKSSPNAGETFAITVTSNTSWTVSLPGWCTADVTSGTGNGTINVTVAGNTGSQRTGNITVAAGALTAICAVTQAAGATDRMFHSRLYMNDYLTSSIRFDITIGVQTVQQYYEFRHFVVFNNSTLDEEWVDSIPASDQSVITNIDVMMNTRSYTGGVYADMWSDGNFLTGTDVMPGGLSYSGNIPGNSVDFIATYSNF